ncbi:MAG: diacylglycerol kinase [Arsenophonus sp. NC-PE1-MAG3]
MRLIVLIGIIELLNSAIESVVDRIVVELHELLLNQKKLTWRCCFYF